ncbi:hypothetical protein FLJC2902T_22710 [Flavobacterium limnosediminis JC2902]|uniref:DNA replication protein n=1 Tax=Flavobacterium limnosediminis JC2902 TaxID=1341181 RepID=V6SK52_9FLAO|nr:hypothetical protein [Flavobacterium limnosediminis]ESU27093.1 hypothetical protein FLJC2902T_22710 [Flavobacterium limnosediminis JC2902]
MDLNLNKILQTSIENRLYKPIIKPLLPKDLKANTIYNYFKKYYSEINGKAFIETNETIAFVYTLIYYFKNETNFHLSPLLYNVPNTYISLDKGLIIIGGYGTGKSSCLLTFQYMLNTIFKSTVTLKFEKAIDVVHEYENLPQEEIELFYEKYCNGFRVIDDLKSEKEASRYGKTDIYKEILFKRCDNPIINSIITSNYSEENPNNMEAAIENFYRYGGRVLDRIYGKFNFIELNGKSFRN